MLQLKLIVPKISLSACSSWRAHSIVLFLEYKCLQKAAKKRAEKQKSPSDTASSHQSLRSAAIRRKSSPLIGSLPSSPKLLHPHTAVQSRTSASGASPSSSSPGSFLSPRSSRSIGPSPKASVLNGSKSSSARNTPNRTPRSSTDLQLDELLALSSPSDALSTPPSSSKKVFKKVNGTGSASSARLHSTPRATPPLASAGTTPQNDLEPAELQFDEPLALTYLSLATAEPPSPSQLIKTAKKMSVEKKVVKKTSSLSSESKPIAVHEPPSQPRQLSSEPSAPHSPAPVFKFHIAPEVPAEVFSFTVALFTCFCVLSLLKMKMAIFMCDVEFSFFRLFPTLRHILSVLSLKRTSS